MTARTGAVLIDLTRCHKFDDQKDAVQAAMAGTPLGTLGRITLGSKTSNPPMWWLSHGIMKAGYQWELSGPAERCAAWLAQYRAETAQAGA